MLEAVSSAFGRSFGIVKLLDPSSDISGDSTDMDEDNNLAEYEGAEMVR